MLRNIFSWFQRPQTWAEESRDKIGIPKDVQSIPILTASVHIGDILFYKGLEQLEFFKGSSLEHNLIRFDYIDVRTATLEEIREFLSGLADTVEKLNLTENQSDETDMETTNVLINKPAKSLRANVGYYPALDKAGYPIGCKGNKSESGILTVCIEGSGDIAFAYDELVKRIRNDGYLAYDLDGRPAQKPSDIPVLV
ncbi:MAG: hypothetical protein AAF988_01295 [Pseudomonadota bacterium]